MARDDNFGQSDNVVYFEDHIPDLPISDHDIAKFWKEHGRIKPSQFVLIVTEPEGGSGSVGRSVAKKTR